MSSATRRCAVVVLAVAMAMTVGSGGAAQAAVKAPFKNCTQLHTVYPHGVGKVGARDKTRSGSKPVTTWKRSTAIYNKAIKANPRLDADHDGIACEKR